MTEFLTLMILFMCPLLTLVTAKRYGAVFWITPLTLISLQILIGVTLKGTLYMFSDAFRGSLSYGSETFLIDAAFYVLLFTILLCVGYLLGIKRPIRSSVLHDAVSSHRFDGKTVFKIATLAAGIFVLTTIALSQVKSNFSGFGQLTSVEGMAQMQRGKIQRIDGVTTHGESFRSITIFYSVIFFLLIVVCTQLGVRAQQHKRALVGVCIMLLAFILVEVLVRGKRNLMLEVFLVLGMIRLGYVARVQASVRSVLVPVALGGLMLVIFSFISVYRASGNSDVRMTTADLFAPLVDTLLLKPYFMDINKMSVIMEESGRYAFQYGASLVDWIVGFVPRAIWPDKPALSLGLFVKSEIFGLDGTIGGIPPTLPGEFYINFGWFGAALALVYGFGLRRLEELLLLPLNVARYGTHWLYPFIMVTVAFSALQTAVGLFAVKTITSLVLVIPALYLLLRATDAMSRTRRGADARQVGAKGGGRRRPKGDGRSRSPSGRRGDGRERPPLAPRGRP